MSDPPFLSGLVANSGIGTGRAVLVIHGMIGDLPVLEPFVLIVDSAEIDLTPVLRNASAVISDSGDLSSPIAFQAKEFGIPCILSTKFATLRINPGDPVTVNADQNSVTWIET